MSNDEPDCEIRDLPDGRKLVIVKTGAARLDHELLRPITRAPAVESIDPAAIEALLTPHVAPWPPRRRQDDHAHRTASQAVANWRGKQPRPTRRRGP